MPVARRGEPTTVIRLCSFYSGASGGVGFGVVSDLVVSTSSVAADDRAVTANALVTKIPSTRHKSTIRMNCYLTNPNTLMGYT